MRSASTASPTPAAVASSSSAPATPPSVGSCIAFTAAVLRAIRAALKTLMPGVNKNDFARSMTVRDTPFAVSVSSASRASIDAPSIAMPCVSTMLSPTCAPEVSTTSSFATSPSIAPMAIGRGRSYVISVWPPMSVMPSESHASSSCAKIASVCASVVPSGSSSVAINQRGVAPITARSLALTCTRYHPIRSVANVIGSVLATR